MADGADEVGLDGQAVAIATGHLGDGFEALADKHGS
jgi:hypothetical protein